MKLFRKLFGKELAKLNTSVEQQGKNPTSVIGNVTESYIGCTININEIEPQWQDRLNAYIATLQQFKPKTALSLLEKLEASFATSAKKTFSRVSLLNIISKRDVLSFFGRTREDV